MSLCWNVSHLIEVIWKFCMNIFSGKPDSIGLPAIRKTVIRVNIKNSKLRLERVWRVSWYEINFNYRLGETKGPDKTLQGNPCITDQYGGSCKILDLLDIILLWLLFTLFITEPVKIKSNQTYINAVSEMRSNFTQYTGKQIGADNNSAKTSFSQSNSTVNDDTQPPSAVNHSSTLPSPSLSMPCQMGTRCHIMWPVWRLVPIEYHNIDTRQYSRKGHSGVDVDVPWLPQLRWNCYSLKSCLLRQ